jgi:hypothetical protein
VRNISHRVREREREGERDRVREKGKDFSPSDVCFVRGMYHTETLLSIAWL